MPKEELTRVEFEFWRRQSAFVARQVVPNYSAADMVAEGMASLVTSMRSYNPTGRMSLGGYVIQRMRWAMLDAARAWRPGTRADDARGVFYISVDLDESRGASTPPAVDTDRIDLARAIATLPPRRRAYVEAYLQLGDVSAAAAAVGMTPNCAFQHHWQAVRMLREILNGPGER